MSDSTDEAQRSVESAHVLRNVTAMRTARARIACEAVAQANMLLDKVKKQQTVATSALRFGFGPFVQGPESDVLSRCLWHASWV